MTIINSIEDFIEFYNKHNKIDSYYYLLLNGLLSDYNYNQILPKILDLEQYFNSIQNPIIINNIPKDQNYQKIISECICDMKDRSELLISCNCGKYTGYYNQGRICDECKSEVKSNLLLKLVNEVWISIPENIGKVLNPLVYLVITEILKIKNKTNESYLKFILDLSLDMPEDLAQYFTDNNGKIHRGIKYFYENFDYVMDVFLNRYSKTKNKKYNKVLKIFLEKYRNVLFTSKLPIMSKYLQPVNNKPGTNIKYVDKSLKNILQSIISLSHKKYINILYSQDSKTSNIEKLIWNMYKKYIDYYIEIIKNKISPKKGYFRKNTFGSRLHFTFRTVISPIIEEHIADEIYIPWKVGLTTLTYHLINILHKRMGFTLIEASNKVKNSYYNYDPVIDQIFQLLILESPFKGIPVCQNRNPSLLISNIILMFIIKINPCLIPISKKFIETYGKIDPDKNKNEYKIIYNIKDIYQSRIKIVDINGYDTPEIVEYSKNNFFDYIVYNNKKYNKTDLKYLIDKNSTQIPYLNAKYQNSDFDGDHLNYFHVLETNMTKYMLDRIHPSNFFIGIGKLEIKSRNNIPRQNISILNKWLQD